MYEEYQIEIPPSFMALYVDPGRSKPNAPRDVVAARYELCEDLATLLMETARNMFLSLRITEKEVLAKCFQGLTGEGAVVSELEAAECVNDFATPGVINLLCSVVYLFAPPVLVD